MRVVEESGTGHDSGSDRLLCQNDPAKLGVGIGWGCLVYGINRESSLSRWKNGTSGSEAHAACDRLVALLNRAIRWETANRAQAGEHEDVWVPLSRFATSQIQMRLRPALEPGWAKSDPVHVVMFGGTNSGKSTVLNLLLGRPAAGMSFRARYSQHPEAYRLNSLGNQFLDAFPSRFPSYTRYQDSHPPRQEDDQLRMEGYRSALAINDPMRMGGPALAAAATVSAVLWDIPDFSTEEAQEYLYPALFDTVALADLVVMVVTRENYADNRGGLLRALLCEAGESILVVANKLESGSDLIDDIRRKLGGQTVDTAPIDPARILPLPQVEAENEVDRLRRLLEAREATAIRNRVSDEVSEGLLLKRQAIFGTLQFLDRRLDDALAPLWADLALAQRWGELVDRLARERFFEAYRREYLDGEQYVDFNQTMVKLMDELEVPWIGPIISGVSKGLKSASRFVFGSVAWGFKQVFNWGGTSAPRTGPEQEIVGEAFDDWYTTLRGELQAMAQSDPNSAWRGIASGLDRLLISPEYVEGLAASYQQYRESMDQITSQRAHSLYNQIAERPGLLNALRGLKVTLDVGTTALIISSKGLDWTDAVIGPLVAPVQRLIIEFGLEQVVALQKSQLKQEQLKALREVVQVRMIDPVRGLYRPAAASEDLIGARRDLAILSEELKWVIKGERSERGS